MNRKILEKLFEYIDIKVEAELIKDASDDNILESFRLNQIKDELINLCDGGWYEDTDEITKLPDGSGFFTESFPLPKDHWIYIKSENSPYPILTREFKNRVEEAAKYAIRTSTIQSKEKDFDPDALVQNFIYALCGPVNNIT
jgi:hypothetical protein